MQIPVRFLDVLEERISFCQAQLKLLQQIPDGASKFRCVSIYKVGLRKITALRKMSAVVTSTANPNAKLRFKESAKAIVAELISSAYDQMLDVSLIEARLYTTDLLEGFKKIYNEIEAI